tara:strand:- start:948 stop:1532 length:585 start_codon:yes stop_codon:yes gene_type:complete
MVIKSSNLYEISMPSKNLLTIWTGQFGLEVYEEIHNDERNRILHTAFLPFVFYGVFRGIPTLFLIPAKYSWIIIGAIISLYCGYYATFDQEGAILSAITTLPTAVLAYWHLYECEYKSMSRFQHFIRSVGYLAGSLFLLEVVGHSLFEDVNSRMTFSYVTNAVIYSPLYYAKTFVEYIPYSFLPTLAFMNWQLS